jgi:hypothetical protein
MDSFEGRIWFIGDLSDPWVVTIADALPVCLRTIRIDHPGDLPERLFDPARPPRVIILHRHRLTVRDAQRLREWRESPDVTAPPALILCVSPYVRYDELERWSGVANLVLPESAAPDVLARHIARLLEQPRVRPARGDEVRFRIEVAGANDELTRALVEACTRVGHRVEKVDERSFGEPSAPRFAEFAAERVLTIWEVPLLEQGWSERLERRSRATGPVIALLSFPDRRIVAQAKALGAIACLELPCNLDDLLEVIDRATRSTPPESWPVPARLEPAHALPPRSRRRTQLQEPPRAMPPFSGPGRRPTMHT